MNDQTYFGAAWAIGVIAFVICGALVSAHGSPQGPAGATLLGVVGAANVGVITTCKKAFGFRSMGFAPRAKAAAIMAMIWMLAGAFGGAAGAYGAGTGQEAVSAFGTVAAGSGLATSLTILVIGAFAEKY